jgi:hypothetical protein
VEEGGEGGQGNSPHPVDCPQEHLGVSHLFDIIGWCLSSCNAEHPQTVSTEDGEDNIVLSENGARGGGDGGVVGLHVVVEDLKVVLDAIGESPDDQETEDESVEDKDHHRDTS